MAKLPFLLPVYLCKKIWIILRKCCILTHFLYQLRLLEKTFRNLPRDRKRLLLDIFRRDIQQLQQLSIDQHNRIVRLGWTMRDNPEIVQGLIEKKLLCYKKIGDRFFSKKIITLTDRTINLFHHRYTCRCQRIASRNKN